MTTENFGAPAPRAATPTTSPAGSPASSPTSPATAAAASSASAPEELDPRIDEYLTAARAFKLRRLRALSVLCAMLLTPLLVIYAKGWWTLSGSGSVGASWVFVGLGVVAAAIAAVVIDLLYRKEL